ncbi:MAG: nucleotidyltransferase family protein [Oscillospiraceae bacterium]|nr:nucleotidyltransferase family protein [Oscillospiraceae bacterium]
MNAVGIISEYNPLHSGHVWHIERTRALLDVDAAVVCVMSGSVAQRGDITILPKWERARAAVLNGANLVVELPAPYACASAEQFAFGGVYLLNAMGIINHISFGSESGDLDALKTAQSALETSTDEFKALMSQGLSYAAARSRAANFPSGANDLLGICYLSAIKSMGADITPIAIKRTNCLSASEIRRRLFAGEFPELPEPPRSELTSLQSGEQLVLAALRDMSVDDWADLPDISEGLEHRFFAAARSAKNLDGLYMSVKSKRYSLSRIRRIVLCAFLGIPRTDDPPPYIRVLAFDKRGAELLKRMKKTSSLPIITKPTHYRELGSAAKSFFELECRVTDKIGMFYSDIRPCGQELRENPFIYTSI